MTGLLRERVVLDAAAQTVWDHVVDWGAQSEWIPLTRARAVAGDGRGVGALVEARTGLGPVGFLDTMTITHWDPPRRCELLHTGRVVRGDGGFEVTPLGPLRCELYWWERFAVPGGPLGALGWQLLAPTAGVGLRATLHRFRRRVEGSTG